MLFPEGKNTVCACEIPAILSYHGVSQQKIPALRQEFQNLKQNNQFTFFFNWLTCACRSLTKLAS